MITSEKFCRLLATVFERHGPLGTNTLQAVRPWKGGSFREGLTEYNLVKTQTLKVTIDGKPGTIAVDIPVRYTMLWYEERQGDGYTSRAIRTREVLR
jgi:hypothetical protein